MIVKYISFIIGIIWSYSIIKTQSVFSKKAGIVFKIFITKVSWFTFIAACYFGYKNFSFKATLIGIAIAVIIVHLGFLFLSNYLSKKILGYSLYHIVSNSTYLHSLDLAYFVHYSIRINITFLE